MRQLYRRHISSYIKRKVQVGDHEPTVFSIKLSLVYKKGAIMVSSEADSQTAGLAAGDLTAYLHPEKTEQDVHSKMV